MDFFSITALLGGLALFLYGMNVMSSGLEKMAGGQMEAILRKMTGNRGKGLLLGVSVTAIIQSSSAVTVMLVGLVNSGIMQLSQAISVTMGSNIGTTVTAWILSLTGIDSSNFFLNLLKPANFSPILALIGVIMLMMCKQQGRRDAGTILIGFAVLMYGMTIMANTMEPLGEMPEFTNLLTAFQNPILGVLAGMLFTALVQSSSASVGVLQVLSMTGTLSYQITIPIIMGQNIGTCISALLASIGTNKNARRVAIVHVLFNVIGTVVCLTAWTIANAVFDFAFATEAVSPFTIAVLHSIFNITTTILLLPFAGWLEKMACVIIPEDKVQEEPELLDSRLLTVPAFAVAKASDVTRDMASMARDSVRKAVAVIDYYDQTVADQVKKLEKTVDDYEDKLGTYLVNLSKIDVTEKENKQISQLLYTISDFERISDHALNLLKVGEEMHKKHISFSFEAKKELDRLTAALFHILDLTTEAFEKNDITLAETVEPLEQVIDYMISKIKDHHVNRLKNGNCTIELGFILTDLLTNYERISDHCSNIGVAIIGSECGVFDTHEYLHQVKKENTGSYAENYAKFFQQYAL